MKIKTKQFGEIEFSEDMLVDFPKGIIGFEKCRRFLIVHDEEYEPFRWLIAVDESEIGFPVLNPFLVENEYDKELPHRLVKRLINAEKPIDIFNVVTLNGEGGKVTINLKSPVIVDYDEKKGEQLILSAENIPVAKPIS